MEIEQIYLSAEKAEIEDGESKGENTDVIVQVAEGGLYVATFFTYEDIGRVREENRLTGDFLNGKYYWANEMVLIDDCSRENIEEVVAHMLETGDFLTAFRKL